MHPTRIFTFLIAAAILPLPRVSHAQDVEGGEPLQQEVENLRLAEKEYERGVELFNSGDHAGGTAAFTKAVELAPGNTKFLSDRMVGLAMLEKFDEALEDAKRLEELEPGNVDTLNRIGFAFAAGNRFEEALPYFLKAYEKRPNDLRILRNVAGSYGQMGKAEEEAEFRKKIGETLIESGDREKAALQLFRWGEEYSAREEDDLAIKEYADALLLEPEFSKARMELARSFIHVGDWKTAVSHCDTLVENDPGNIEAIFLRGTALMDADDPSRALPDLNRVLAVDPDHESANYNRALVHQTLKEFDLAIEGFKRYARLDPEDHDPLERIADMFRAQGNNAGCMEALDKLLELLPNHQSGLFLAAKIYEEEERYEEAETMVDKLLAVKPDFADGYNNRGYYRLEQGKTEEALADFNKAIELQPDHLFATRNKVTALEELGREDEAAAARKILEKLEEAEAEETVENESPEAVTPGPEE